MDGYVLNAKSTFEMSFLAFKSELSHFSTLELMFQTSFSTSKINIATLGF